MFFSVSTPLCTQGWIFTHLDKRCRWVHFVDEAIFVDPAEISTNSLFHDGDAPPFVLKLGRCQVTSQKFAWVQLQLTPHRRSQHVHVTSPIHWLMDLEEIKLHRHMGVSLNGGTPKTPQNDHFLVGKLRKTHGCWVPPF